MSQIYNTLGVGNNWINFLTDPKENLQIGVMVRPKGYEIKPHYHNETQEVLYIVEGIIDVLCENEWHTAEPGHIIHFTNGVHCLRFVTDAKIVEVKQGPFKNDKVYV